MKTVMRQDLPPKASGVMWVERIGANEKQQFTVYSPHIIGIWTHYTRHGTRPCYEDRANCEGGHHEETLRWKGYVHVWSFFRNKQAILQLTGRAARMWLEQVATDCILRGQRVELWRGKKSNGPVSLAVQEHLASRGRDLPPPLDPFPSLWSLWRMMPTLFVPESQQVTRVEQIPDDESEAG